MQTTFKCATCDDGNRCRRCFMGSEVCRLCRVLREHAEERVVRKVTIGRGLSARENLLFRILKDDDLAYAIKDTSSLASEDPKLAQAIDEYYAASNRILRLVGYPHDAEEIG